MYEPGVTPANKEKEELAVVEKDCQKYRSYLLLVDKLLEWEPAYVPGVAIALVTVLFAITWYMEPSIITSLSLIGILVCLLEYAAPFISNHFYKQPEQWNVILEARYSKVCERIVHAKKHLQCCCNQLCKMKTDKPNSFLLAVVGFLLLTAWIGSFIDTLLLIYLAVVVLVLIPGLRKHGLLQKVTDLIKSKISKPKAN